VEKLGLIALLCQASHFPVFDWLSTSLKYLTQSANILSVTQVIYTLGYITFTNIHSRGKIQKKGEGILTILHVTLAPKKGLSAVKLTVIFSLPLCPSLMSGKGQALHVRGLAGGPHGTLRSYNDRE